MDRLFIYEDENERRSRFLSIFFIFAGIPAVALGFYWMLYLVPKNSCPSDTLFSGYVLGSGLVALMVVGLCIIALGLGYSTGTGRNSMFSPEQLSIGRRRFRVLGWILILPSLLWWLPNSKAYYCASPGGIEFRSGLFSQSKSYAWTQISKVLPHCSSGKGAGVGMSIYLPDELILEIWHSAGSPIEPKMKRLSQYLKGTDFRYDLSQAERECPNDWKSYFSKIPGFEVVH